MLIDRLPPGLAVAVSSGRKQRSLPSATEGEASDASEISLLAQYLAASTAHQDMIRRLHSEISRQAYQVLARELSRRIIDFHLAA